MQLLLIRHAIAEEQEDFAKTGKDDRLRPLTDEGRKKLEPIKYEGFAAYDEGAMLAIGKWLGL